MVIHPAVDDLTIARLDRSEQLLPTHPARLNSETLSVTRSAARARLGVGEGDFLVLCIGTIEPRKGQVLLLKTLAKKAQETGLPIKLALVGFKNWKRRLAFLSRLSPSERRVLSPSRCFVRQSEIASFYKAADAFVMNTQGIDGSGGECFGRVTIEAMAAGAVVLGTDKGGTREIIEHERSGFLFPVGPQGQTVLADHVEELARNPSLADRMSVAGKARIADEFTQKRFLGEFELALKRLD